MNHPTPLITGIVIWVVGMVLVIALMSWCSVRGWSGHDTGINIEDMVKP